MVRTHLIALAGLAAFVLAGCAKIEYVKVPSPTQYETWNDTRQAAADRMEGVRYYLPRPYVNLKQPTPVAQRVAFVSFTLDPDRNVYVLNTPRDAPTWLLKIVPTEMSFAQAYAAMTITTDGAMMNRVSEEQTDEIDDAPTPTPDDEKPPTELTARTGFISDTDPVTRLSETMDVVYLPDFDEQYVIRVKGGLGEIDVETKLRNGWAAEVFAQKIDNSNLIPYVIRQVERASEAAAGIATTWMPLAMGLPPGTSPARLADLATSQIGEQSDDRQTAKDLLGEVLLFKIAEVRIAQPGVYPILKPREMRDWFGDASSVLTSGADPEETFELFLEQANTPWVRTDMAFVPCPPFTVVGFNVTTDAFILPATERLDAATTAQANDGRIQFNQNGTNNSNGNNGIQLNQSSNSPASIATMKRRLAGATQSIDPTLTARLKLDADQIDIKSAGAKTQMQIATMNLSSLLTEAEASTVTNEMRTWMSSTFELTNPESQVSVKLDKKQPNEKYAGILITMHMPLDTLKRSLR
ncbi:MAG: hypothetical protein AAF432_08565 [Planctomycetota bacterium]